MSAPRENLQLRAHDEGGIGPSQEPFPAFFLPTTAVPVDVHSDRRRQARKAVVEDMRIAEIHGSCYRGSDRSEWARTEGAVRSAGVEDFLVPASVPPHVPELVRLWSKGKPALSGE